MIGGCNDVQVGGTIVKIYGMEYGIYLQPIMQLCRPVGNFLSIVQYRAYDVIGPNLIIFGFLPVFLVNILMVNNISYNYKENDGGITLIDNKENKEKKKVE